MEKPEGRLINHWIANNIKLCLHYKSGKIEHAYLKACHGLAIFVYGKENKFDNGSTRKVVLLSSLEKISEYEKTKELIM